MANTTISTNMSMPIPVVGVDPGPQWATDINSCLTILDQHDHSSGYGVPITPDGLNISSDLSFGSNNATLLRSARFSPQSVVLSDPTDLGCLYEVGVDLYYNDGSGNQVRLTQGGAVAGTPGSIANLVSPASASYVSGTSTFVFQSAANTPANIDGASFLLRNLVANSKALTLSPPSAMGADYSIVLPSLPGSTKIVSIDSSGNMGSVYDVDNVTLEIASNLIQVKNLGITTAKLADNSVSTAKIIDANVTRPKLAAVGQQISLSSGSFVTASTTPVDVTNLTVTITTSGRPVFVGLMSDNSAGNSASSIGYSGPGASAGVFRILRDSTQVANVRVSANSLTTMEIAPGCCFVLDVVTAGTYVYKLQANVVTATGAFVTRCVLIAYEL